MSQVEDRLRSALATAPTPATTIGDPIADLDRRIGRARMRLGGVAIVIVVLLVAAIVVPLALVGGGNSEQPLQNTPLIPFPGTSKVTSTTAGGGAVWSINELFPRLEQERFVLQRRNPVTGRVQQTYRVTTPEEFVAYGAGAAWAYGGGDGGYPRGVVDVIPEGGGARHTVDLGYGKGVDTRLNSMAFYGRDAFAVRENGGYIVRLDRDQPRSALADVLRVPGAEGVFVVGTTVVVAGLDHVVAQFPADGEWPPAVAPAPDIPGMPVSADSQGLWSWYRKQLVHTDLDGHQLVKPLPIVGQPLQAVTSPDGGLFIAAAVPAHRSGRADRLYYYSPAAVAAGAAQPTEVRRLPVDDLALDPAGGVVVGRHLVAGGADVFRWDPGSTADR